MISELCWSPLFSHVREKEQVKNILEETDHDGRSLLAMAVSGGNETIIKKALEILREHEGIEVTYGIMA